MRWNCTRSALLMDGAGKTLFLRGDTSGLSGAAATMTLGRSDMEVLSFTGMGGDGQSSTRGPLSS